VKYQSIILEREGRVGMITLNRPEKRNALSARLVTEMLQVLHELDEDPGIGAIILRGSGDSFCSGHDFLELQGKNVLELRRVFKRSLHLVETIAALSKPVIAAVHGYATAMGCALAAGCDLVIAAEDALFQLPGAGNGAACISPAAVVGRSIGRKKCLELILTGDPISAEQAERAGLINRVVPRGELDKAVNGLATKLASNAPLALQLGKEAVYAMSDMEQGQAYRYAAEMISINIDTEDGREGINAFMAKRKPRPWKGQ
jgi:enoyl-CoA hydratase/carnithine racemase